MTRTIRLIETDGAYVLKGTFQITANDISTNYTFVEVGTDYGRRFIVENRDSGIDYEVTVGDEYGPDHCTCPGHRYGKGRGGNRTCRHVAGIRALIAADKIPSPVLA